VSVTDNCGTSTGNLTLRVTGGTTWNLVETLDDGTGAGCTCTNCFQGDLVADGADGYIICVGYNQYWNTYGGGCQADYGEYSTDCYPNNEVGEWVWNNQELAVELLATIFDDPVCCGDEVYPQYSCAWISSSSCSVSVYRHHRPRTVKIYEWDCS